MRPLPQWWSQPFPPQGGTASNGIRKQLGNPQLDPLVVLVREAAQNSWDAKIPGSTEAVHFGISLRCIRGESLAAWRDALLPAPLGTDNALQHETAEGELQLLVVSDRGTTGLGGALRSDVQDDEDPDFVNFVRNVGEARDKDLGGGTYGFGKGIFYTLSAPHAILIDTSCVYRGRLERRLIGSLVGDSFTLNGRRYTGRHWWGEIQEDIPDPVMGDGAELRARQLGLPDFVPGQLGTDLVVIAPRLGERADGEPRSAYDAACFIASAIGWNLWPKMVARNGQSDMTFSVDVDGEPVPIPDPATDERLMQFADALGKIDRGEGDVRRRNLDGGQVDLGYFAHALGFVPPRASEITDLAAPFVGSAHHCARMRHAELVVDYYAGPEHPNALTQYAAVFRASSHREIDHAFAEAEPPTHDDWVVTQLTGSARLTVRAAEGFVRDMLREVVPSETPKAGAPTQIGLGALANQLAGVLAGAEGDAPGADEAAPGLGGSGGGGAPAPMKTLHAPVLERLEGAPFVVSKVQASSAVRPLRLVATAEVGLDGSTERTAPEGAAVPIVRGWQAEETREWRDGAALVLHEGDVDVWTVYVEPAPDAATRLKVRAGRLAEDGEDA